MNRERSCNIALLVIVILLSGCETNDRLLFATKTNYGLDIDSKPPTAEVTIARRELAITPTFQDAGRENTLPLLASFGLSGQFFDPEITSRFAGGDAAVILAEGPDNAHQKAESFLCLSKEPYLLPAWKWAWKKLSSSETSDDSSNESVVHSSKNENARDFYFATDTSFGLKAAWDGSTGPYPSTLKLGYNRKELAFPPIFAQKVPKKECSDKADASDTKEWKVTLPSFVASLNNSSVISSKEQSGVSHVQFFATGKAANEFVKRREVNSALNKAMYPHNDLSIYPETAAVMVGSKQTFATAGGKGLVRFTPMHDPTVAGQIDSSTGIYAAGTIPGTYAIGAADSAGNTAIAAVTVYSQLAITPTSQNVTRGETLQFTATGGVPPFKFSISPNQSGGSIDEKGLYTAGNTGGMTDKVKVTDSALPANSVETTINVQ